MSYSHAGQNLDASSIGVGGAAGTNTWNELNTFNVSAGYIWDRFIGFRGGVFTTSGTTDSVLYGQQPVTGSATGSPNSNGFLAEVDFTPWLNTKLSLQYTNYFNFNGASTNYDGSNRNAGDNNTVYVLAWLVF